MSLTDGLGGHPHEARLRHCELAHRASENGRRICQNLTASLDGRLIENALFEHFRGRLGELLPDPPGLCDQHSVLAAIDSPEAFYCRGPMLDLRTVSYVSRLLDLNAFLYAKLGRRPSAAEYADELEGWRIRQTGGRASVRHTLRMGGRRPFFWVTTDALQAFGFDPDRAKDATGLSHLRRGRYLLETRLRCDQVERLHRPTGLDALDSPTFYVAQSADGWGTADDLTGIRPTAGLPEAVTPAVELGCEIIPWGELQHSPDRI